MNTPFGTISSLTDAEKKIAVDKFVASAYNNPTLMKFIAISVQTFEAKSTTKLMLHVQNGVAKGGDASLSF